MKTISSKIIMVVAFIATLFLSCEKGSKDIIDQIIPPKFTATINGEAWSAVAPIAKFVGDSAAFTLTGISANTKTLNITIKNCSAAGTFTQALPNTLQCNATFAEGTSLDVDNSFAGVVIVSEINQKDKTITGTFHFSMKSFTNQSVTYEITDGKFTALKY